MKMDGKAPLESIRMTSRRADPVELLYSEVVANEKLKHGTKYERLAAIVFKELRHLDVVTHDIRLRGDGRRTRHQIDVRLTAPTGRRLRAIVECRHLFGKKGTKKLGLPAIRDFASVQRDLQADEAWILTTVGFTGPAETYAEEQGIRLATLSAPARGPQRIDFRGEVGAPSDLRVTQWLVVDDAERERVAPLLAAQDVVEGWIDAHATYFVDENGRPGELFHDVIDPIYQRLQRDLKRGTNVGQELFDRPRRVVLGEVPVAVRGFDWEIDLTYGRFDFSIDLADKLVRLLLESLDGRVKESFTLPQLRRWAIGPEDRLVREANDG
jgi:hypothetical protein